MIGPVVFIAAQSPPAFVLDASITEVWELTRRANQYTDNVQYLLRSQAARVPTSWSLDVTSRLLIAERSGETNQSRVDQFLSRLPLFQIVLDDEAPFRFFDILNLARIHGLSALKAEYLELAIRYSLPLATIDPSLTQAATTAGVSIFVP